MLETGAVTLRRWMWGAIVGLACAGAATGGWLFVGDAACSTMNLLPDHDGPCIEFWLNRYQTLVVGLLGIAAAVYAAKLAWRSAFAGIRAAEEAEKKRSMEQWQTAKDVAESAWNIATPHFATFQCYLDNQMTKTELAIAFQDLTFTNLQNLEKIVTSLATESSGRLKVKITEFAIFVGNLNMAAQNILTESRKANGSPNARRYFLEDYALLRTTAELLAASTFDAT